jgi:hypothetical protein
MDRSVERWARGALALRGRGGIWRGLGIAVVASCLLPGGIGTAIADESSKESGIPAGGDMGSTEASGGAAVTLSLVPEFNWYHGCGPTGAASVLGYYDVHGFDNLFTASGWDNVKLTVNVQDQISSPAHNAKYDPTPDNTTWPVPAYTSIADWFHTSADPQEYGWSYLSYAAPSFSGYASYRGYQCTSWSEGYGAFTWQDLVGEINNGRPMLFLVDSDGNGGTDHFVPVFGYDDRGVNGLYYACYTNWAEAESVSWYQFRPMASGQTWGVGYATFVIMSPEPGSLALLGIAGSALLMRRRGRRTR